MKVTIVGLGLIGGSLGLDLRSRGWARQRVGVEFDPRHVEQALELGVVDSVETLEQSLKGADLVILAVPVDAILKLLPEVMTLVESGTTVTDMGSTKESICRAVVSHPKREQFVASHPMAGTENSGPLAALAGLFDNKTAVLCERERSGSKHLGRVEAFYGVLGMRLVSMSAEEHDLHAAYISHLSHISSFVLANTVLAQEKNTRTIFDLAGGGFESTVRLAKSSPEMWTPIFEQNRPNVIAALEAYIGQLQEFRRTLIEEKIEVTRKLMEDATRIRPVLASISTRARSQK